MPALEVKCTVSDCFFHAKGNFCGAEKIEINTNPDSQMSTNTEFAAEFNLDTDTATTSTNTCCKTFISKKQKT